MKLEDRVCSLEYAKKLKELEIVKESYFYWKNIDTPYPHIVNVFYPPDRSGDFWISAFTGDELLSFLPHYVTSKKHEKPFNNFRLKIDKRIIYTNEDSFHSIYCINYLCDTFGGDELNQMQNNPFIGNLFNPNIYDKKFSDALAKVLIRLIEDNLIEKKAGG